MRRLPDQEASTIAQVADEVGVDPKFLASIRIAEGGRKGREFGVLSESAPTYEAQARKAAVSIRANITRYEQAKGEPAIKDGQLSEDFTKFMASRWAPVGAGNDPQGLNANWPRNVTAAYRQMGGTEVPTKETIRLRSTQDPSVIIEGPVGAPYDPREWQPLSVPVKASPQESLGGRTAVVGANPMLQIPIGPEDQKGMREAVMPNVLPTMGATMGTALGPWGSIGGSLLGEAANQVLGITEPSMMGAAAAAIPTGLAAGTQRAAAGIGKAALKRAPKAGVVMHEAVGEAMQEVPEQIRRVPFGDLSQLRNTFPDLAPQAKAEDLYALVGQFNPRIALSRTNEVAVRLLDKEQAAAAGLKLPGITKTLKEFQPRQAGATEVGQAMSFQDARVNLRRIGDKIRETREIGGEEHGAWKAMRKAMMEDLEAAAERGNEAMPAVQALKAANLAAKREFAADELADIMSIKGGGITIRAELGTMRGGEPQIQVNLNRIITQIRKSEDLQRSLDPAEYRAILKDLTRIAKDLPALPSGAADAGSKATLSRVAGFTGLGTLVGGMTGGPFGMAMGSAAGAVAGTIGEKTLARLVISEPGRALLSRVLLGSGGTLSAQSLAILATAVGTSEMGREGMQQGAQLGQNLMGGVP